MSRKNITVSFIIVFHSNKKDLLDCIFSLSKFKVKYNFEVIVVDNSGKLDYKIQSILKSKVKNSTFVSSVKNGGYGAGNNLGSKCANGEFLFILNPDIQFKDRSVNSLIEFAISNKKVAAVSPQFFTKNQIPFLLLGSRKLTPLNGMFVLSILSKIFPNNMILKKYWMLDVNHSNLRQVDVVPGSAFLIRKSIFDAVGGFDEKFFLYFEESDLCRRIQNKFPKYKFFIFPEAEVIHDWRPQNPGTKVSRKIYAKSRFYYFRKHYGILSALVVELFARISKKFLITVVTLFAAALVFMLIF